MPDSFTLPEHFQTMFGLRTVEEIRKWVYDKTRILDEMRHECCMLEQAITLTDAGREALPDVRALQKRIGAL